jgi:transcription termination factor Rho
MIKFNGKKYELLFSNNLLPFWALHYVDLLFFREFKKQCGNKYNVLSIIEKNWQKKYAELHSLDELTNAFAKKAKDRKWLNELKTTYREKTIKVENYLKLKLIKRRVIKS